MGQYYYVVNPKKRQYLHPHKFGDGLKLLEFGCSGSGTMLGLAVLLADGNGRGRGDLHDAGDPVGSWAGDPIVVTGDYADDGNFVSDEDNEAVAKKYAEEIKREGGSERDQQQALETKYTLHAVAGALYEDISYKVIVQLCKDRHVRKDLRESLQRFSGGPLPDEVKHALKD